MSNSDIGGLNYEAVSLAFFGQRAATCPAQHFIFFGQRPPPALHNISSFLGSGRHPPCTTFHPSKVLYFKIKIFLLQ
jgi:hypothetical protein